jgi:hypothetical protein
MTLQVHKRRKCAVRYQHVSPLLADSGRRACTWLPVRNVTNAIMGEEVAMLTMLELPERGCWEITGNYKDAYLSFVVWLD